MQTLAVFVLVALLIGLSKGGFGGSVPVSLTAPILILVMSPQQAVGIILPLLLFADAIALYFYWGQWDMRYIRLLVPMSVIGVIIGTVLLATLDGSALKRSIGLLTLVAVLYKVFSERVKRWQYQPQTWHGQLVGGLSGLASALANAGSPPYTAYMLLQPPLSPQVFIATTTLFFAVVNWLKVPGFLASGVLDVNLLAQIMWVMPIIPFGVWAGRRLIRAMNPKWFENMMVGLLFLISVWFLLG
jgi:uncharacterized membrane protein YfcA